MSQLFDSDSVFMSENLFFQITILGCSVLLHAAVKDHASVCPSLSLDMQQQFAYTHTKHMAIYLPLSRDFKTLSY